MKTRTPKIAGSWYPASAEAIEAMLPEEPAGPVLPHPAAIVVPHAGYAYSADVAAAAYSRLPAAEYDKVIILAPSHCVAMRRSFSVEPAADVATPFGTVSFPAELHDALAALPGARYVPAAHPGEHAIDIQLPLIKRYLPHCAVGGLVVGEWNARLPEDAEMLRAFAKEFRKIVDKKTLVVVSSDFTHYGRSFGYIPFRDNVQERLRALDGEMVEALSKNDPLAWSDALARTGATVCGASPLLLLLAALPEEARFEQLAYATSGEKTRDWSHVVSYAALAVFADWSAPLKAAPAAEALPGALSGEAGAALVRIARRSLRAAVAGEKAEEEALPAAVKKELASCRGAFVTLTENGDLRGCIGRIVPDGPVERVVREMAAAAALEDTRFFPVGPEELDKIEVEVSVLTPPKEIAGPEEIVLGRDGVILFKHGRSAVFLPQVAPEQGWDLETTLSQLSRKAGLPPDVWRSGARFETFQAQIFR
jgi:hypothetical protein